MTLRSQVKDVRELFLNRRGLLPQLQQLLPLPTQPQKQVYPLQLQQPKLQQPPKQPQLALRVALLQSATRIVMVWCIVHDERNRSSGGNDAM